MSEDFTPEVDNESAIEFNAPIAGWYEFIFISSIVILTLFTLLLSNFKLNVYFPFIITAFGFGTYYGSRYFTLALTTLKINNNSLSIIQDGKRLDRYKELHIPLAAIRGFEIAEVTRGNKALFIYTNTFNYYKYSLSKTKEELQVQQYLSKHIQLLDKKSNPLFSSFFSAFLFALKKSFLFLLTASGTIAILQVLNITYHVVLPLGKELILLSFIIGISYWWFIIRKPVQKHYFRFGAFYWLSNLFLYVPILILLPIFLNIGRIKEEPTAIHRSFELFKVKKGNIFLIDQVSYRPDSLFLSHVIVGSAVKGKTFPVTHWFATPLGSGDTIKKYGLYNLWLVKSYKQNVQKSLEVNVKQQEVYNFQNQSKNKFISEFEQKPIFYTLINDDNATNLIKSSSNSSKFNVTLEPHWESLNDYKKDILKQTCYMVLIMIALQLVGCIFIAINR